MVDEMENPTINPVAERFYDNLAKIIRATAMKGKMMRSEVETNATQTAEFYLENEDEYPLQAKLATIEIELDNGTTVTYFDLSEEHQNQFLEDFTQYEAQQLSDKISAIPPLEAYIGEQNEIVEEVTEEFGAETRSGDILISDPNSFFAVLSSRLNEMAINFEYPENATVDTRVVSFGGHGEDSVRFDRVRSLMNGVVKRGDVIVSLPCHNNPMCLVDFGNKKYLVGHAEIFTEPIVSTTSETDDVTIGAWTKSGVSRQSLENWCWRSYVVGICKYKIKWKWRGFKSRFYPVKTPVSDPSLLASWAENYEGREYVKWYEFATPKWAAPARFTCTTLVWWCAKKAYGVKISPWYRTLVTPSDVLCDSNTYLKVEIK